MKKIALIAALLVTAQAGAQTDKPAPTEPAKPATQEAAPKVQEAAPKVQEAAPKVEKPAAKKASPAKRQEDARHCLDKATNTEIIKCAEAYL
jgi:hypothetical protein